MRYLVDGHRWFRNRVFPAKRGLYSSLAKGQRPRYLFIACSDSRVQPHEFTQTEAGDIFMDRSIGNLVPPPGRGEFEALAVIEYAVVALGVSHIVVCGHTDCGAIKALLDPKSLRKMPTVRSWLANARETRKVIRTKCRDLQGEDLLNAAIRENVLVQLDHLRAFPCVASRLIGGRLQIHGWVYDFKRGEATAYDPEAGKFLPLETAYRFAEV
jgi:carbonic anhydrase